MNVLFLMSSPRSHIIPTEPLIKELNDKGCKVYCISTVNNKEMIEKFGAYFISYPDFIEPASCTNLNLNEVMLETNKYWLSGMIKEGYDYIIEKDIESVFDIKEKQIDFICDIVDKYSIELLFRDAVDKLGRFVADRKQLCCIGYMTHNIYSKKYFQKDSNNLYAILMNAKTRLGALPKGYFGDLRERSEILYHTFSIGNYPIYTHHQLDAMSEFTIVFSTEHLQPKESFYENRKYLIVHPLESRFKIEGNINLEIIEFINTYNVIIYISSGSFITQSYNYYKKFIDVLSKNNIGIIVSAGRYNYILKEYINNKQLKNIYVDEYIPQKYVLQNTNVFITSGGQNSILEAIYFKVPLLVTPMTSEQRLNGLLVDKLGIGRTTYSLNNRDSIWEMLNDLLNKKIDSKLMEVMSEELIMKTDFAPMWKFIYESKEKY